MQYVNVKNIAMQVKEGRAHLGSQLEGTDHNGGGG